MQLRLPHHDVCFGATEGWSLESREYILLVSPCHFQLHDENLCIVILSRMQLHLCL